LRELVMLDSLILAAAARQGLRTYDFSVVWDGSEFDPFRDIHELMITTRDGRQAVVRLEDEALSEPWRTLGPIQDAFRCLTKRVRPDGA
jgi:hypothetical protein